MAQTIQTYELHVGNIPVTVERKAVRTLRLRVRSDGSVRMSVPWHVSKGYAARFLDAHADWVRSHAKPARSHYAADEQGFVPLWGKRAKLPRGNTVDALYKEQLAVRLPEVVRRMESALGVSASAWQLRAMSTRWGSCTPKTRKIRINVRLAAYPPTCLDYVVAHELAHLIEPSHNKRFHEIVARAYPNEKYARTLLRNDPNALLSK